MHIFVVDVNRKICMHIILAMKRNHLSPKTDIAHRQARVKGVLVHMPLFSQCSWAFAQKHNNKETVTHCLNGFRGRSKGQTNSGVSRFNQE